MPGMINTSGSKAATLADHVRQSIHTIISTPLRSRVMRRDFGSVIPDLIDQPLNSTTLLRLYAATAVAVMRWEPRFNVASVQFIAAGTAEQAGRVTIEISGTLVTGSTTTPFTTTTTL